MQSQSAAQAIPFHTRGMRIGLLGGSFNPPHAAHRAISLFAIKRLQLDRVWWLVSPGNPLKHARGPHDTAARAAAARAVAQDPRIDVSCLEAVIGTRYTVDTISYLRRRCAGARFVWIMIPVIADGLKPFTAYAAGTDADRAKAATVPTIAIVIAGLGVGATKTADAIMSSMRLNQVLWQKFLPRIITANRFDTFLNRRDDRSSSEGVRAIASPLRARKTAQPHLLLADRLKTTSHRNRA